MAALTRIPQGVAFRWPFKAVLAADHVTPATGKVIAVTLSKNGGAFGNPSAGPTNATETGAGWYYADLSPTDTGALGPLALRGVEGTIDDAGESALVVNPHSGGWDALPSAAFTAIGGLQQALEDVGFEGGDHAVAGLTFYVDGTAGDDATGDGSRLTPYKTISKAISVVVSNRCDQIVLLPDIAGSPTQIVEAAPIVVNKNYVQIHGPGRAIEVILTAGANRDVFQVSASGVGLSGMRVTTNGASSNGVTIQGAADGVLLEHLWIENATQDAVQINVATRCDIRNMHIIAAGRDGVRVSSGAGAGDHNKILDCSIRDCVGSGVNLLGADAGNCRIQRNTIRDCAVGVTIGFGVADTILTDNRLSVNTTPYVDNGTNSFIQWNVLKTDIAGRIDLGLIKGAVPATLSASGYTPAILQRWLTDDAPGTPLALAANRPAVQADVVGDKTGYALTAGEHVAIQNEAQAAIQAQGYTAARAGYLDMLNGLITNIWAFATAQATVAGSIGKRIVDFLTGDTFGRLGAPAHGTVSADIALIDAAEAAAAIVLNALTQGVAGVPAAVWANIDRTLTAPVGTIPAITGSRLLMYATTDLRWQITSTLNLSTATEIWFTVKESRRLTDLQAALQLTLSAGLARLAGAVPAHPTDGTLALELDNVTVTLTLAARSSALLPYGFNYDYDLKALLANGSVVEVALGFALVSVDLPVTQAIA